MKRQLLYVDGYNMIGAWPELVQLKNHDRMADARDLLLFELSNYAKYEGIEIIVVFDAQLVPGIQQTFKKYQLTVVFTETDQTADTYIEKEAGRSIDRLTQVTVATSDLAEQWVVFSRGALRKSANELYKDIGKTREKIYRETESYHSKKIRRNSPWSVKQLESLEFLRDYLSD